MDTKKRILFLVLFAFTVSCRASSAEELKYSFGPTCKDKQVICRNPNEEPVCIVLNPRVHLETINFISSINTKKINRFQPTCTGYDSSFSPSCVDLDEKGYPIYKNAVVECVEKVKCQKDEKTNKISAFCPGGKEPKCLGSDKAPNCDEESICGDKSVPVCDYIWKTTVL